MANNKRYLIRTHALPPSDTSTDEERLNYENDLFITRSLGEEMHLSGPYCGIRHRLGGPEEITRDFHANLKNQILFLAFKDQEPVGMLGGVISNLFDLDYVATACLYLYVRPSDRDGKSAALLLSAFREWSEVREADEMRIFVTSADNSDKSHEMLTLLDFVHLGGNFAFPLSEKGRSVLAPLQPSRLSKTRNE